MDSGEKILIGGWLLKEHLEDLDKVQPSDFSYFPSIVKAIKERGANLLKVKEVLNLPITDLTEMTGLYQPTFYRQAMNELIAMKAKKYLASLKPDTDLKEIADTLNGFAEAQAEKPLPEPEKDLSMRFIAELDRRSKDKPVSWGMESLDRFMGGIRTKELTSIGARPSVGKSAFLLQVALNIARQGKKVLYFPLEMDTIQTSERIVQSYADIQISQENLRRGNLTEAEWRQMSVAADKLNALEKSGNFEIFEGENDLSSIRRLIKLHKPFAVVIDQLTQLRDGKFDSKREQFSHMTNELKRISMAEDCAVLLACQVNRSAQETEPTMANLKESGSIEEDSDNIILLHRCKCDDEEWSDLKRPILIKIEKQRSGATGVIQAVMFPRKFKFYEVTR